MADWPRCKQCNERLCPDGKGNWECIEEHTRKPLIELPARLPDRYMAGCESNRVEFYIERWGNGWEMTATCQLNSPLVIFTAHTVITNQELEAIAGDIPGLIHWHESALMAKLQDLILKGGGDEPSSRH